MSRILVGLAVLTVLVQPGPPSQWLMAGKDAAHTNSVLSGPETPLRRAWVAESDDPESSFTNWPVVKGDVVYARSAGGALAVNGPSGERIWWTDTQGSKQVAPIVDDRNIYMPVGTLPMASLRQADGGREWSFEEEGNPEASGVISDGRLFFGLVNPNAFYCLDASTGQVRWKVVTEFDPTSVPAVADGVVIFSTEHLGSPLVIIHAVEAETGREIWRVEQKESQSSASIHDGKVIFGGGDFFAYALDLKTGKEIWKSEVEDKFDPWNMPAIAFGDVFLADRIGNIYRLDGQTGRRKWIFRDTEGTMDQSFPVIAGKTLFIGSGAGWLYALDVDTGKLLWRDRVEGIVMSGAADSERFYFGVKLGPGEGLYAYEHDPTGASGLPTPTNPLLSLLGGLLLFLLLFGGLVLYVRRRNARRA